MEKKPWWSRSICCILFLLFTFINSQAQQKSNAGPLELIVTNCHTASGNLLVSLFNHEKGFPEDPHEAYLQRIVRPTVGIVKIKWDNIPAGVYAIAVLHDENNDGKMNTNLLGIPTEGFGFSNNKLGLAGPPSFQRASFLHRESGTVLRIQLRNY